VRWQGREGFSFWIEITLFVFDRPVAMPLALQFRYHTVTLTIVRRYLNVTRRFLKKKNAGYKRPRASFYWASNCFTLWCSLRAKLSYAAQDLSRAFLCFNYLNFFNFDWTPLNALGRHGRDVKQLDAWLKNVWTEGVLFF
jgi:hypothetical protein